MKLARSREGISISQRKYTLDLLKETSMTGCRSADTPIEFNAELDNDRTKSCESSITYVTLYQIFPMLSVLLVNLCTHPTKNIWKL